MEYVINVGTTFVVEAESEDEAIDLAFDSLQTTYGVPATSKDFWAVVADAWQPVIA